MPKSVLTLIITAQALVQSNSLRLGISSSEGFCGLANRIPHCPRSISLQRGDRRLFTASGGCFVQRKGSGVQVTRNLGKVEPSSKRRCISAPAMTNQYLPQRLSVAPMMEWTDLHYRQLARIISKHTYLYTEMVVDSTITHTKNLDRFLWFPPEQKPIVCQLGGSNPETLALSAAVVESYGYDEINLNCGCPSDKVAGAGCFGAKLMLNPTLVAQCCSSMQAACKLPITVKCRIGVDEIDDYASLCKFISTVSTEGGVDHFIIHARKCILKGLSPAENRTVPPLRRGWVLALKRDFPQLEFSLNGVVADCHEASAVNQHEYNGNHLHGVMIGRAAYHAPWACLADADRSVFGCTKNAAKSRRQVFEEYGKYGDAIIGKFGSKNDGSPYPSIRTVVKPLLGMLHGEKGTKRYKQELDRLLKGVEKREGMTVSKVIQEALQVVPPEVLDAPPKMMPTPEISFTDIPDTPEPFSDIKASGEDKATANHSSADAQTALQSDSNCGDLVSVDRNGISMQAANGNRHNTLNGIQTAEINGSASKGDNNDAERNQQNTAQDHSIMSSPQCTTIVPAVELRQQECDSNVKGNEHDTILEQDSLQNSVEKNACQQNLDLGAPIAEPQKHLAKLQTRTSVA